MQLFICLFVGAIVSWAMKSRNEQNSLGWWRPFAGALAAGLPYIDYVFLFAAENIQQAYMQGITWSLIFAPLLATLSAFVISFISRRSFVELSRISIGAYIVSLILATLTSRGVPIFAPISYWRASFDVLSASDWYLFCLFVLITASCIFLRAWQRDVARVGMLVVAGYIAYVVTLSFDAYRFGEDYAKAFGLKVEEINTLPQPLSPNNWRVIVETEDQRIHDTLINLARTEELVRDDRSSRTERIDSLYKPTDKAVWRIYHRFGHKQRAFSKSAYLSMYKHSDQFKDLSEYWVGKDVIVYNSNKCARYIDIRREGSRKAEESLFMICKEGRGAVLYRADGEKGHFSEFEMMY